MFYNLDDYLPIFQERILGATHEEKMIFSSLISLFRFVQTFEKILLSRCLQEKFNDFIERQLFNLPNRPVNIKTMTYIFFHE